MTKKEILKKAKSHIEAIRKEADNLLTLWEKEEASEILHAIDWKNTFPSSLDEWVFELREMEETLEDS